MSAQQHPEVDWVILEIKTNIFEDKKKNRIIENFKNRSQAITYLDGFKDFIHIAHGEDAVLNIEHYIKPLNPYRG